MENSSGKQDSQSQPSLPPSKQAPGGWRSVKYILGNETFEKLASMSLIGNLAVYLSTKYNMEGTLLVTVTSTWSGSTNVTPILGALISDAFLGRYRTLLYGSTASFLGMVIIALTAGIPDLRPPSCVNRINCVDPQNWQLAILIGGLAFLAIGAGGIRPCNIAFGADQFDTTTKKGRAQLESFFNWWYFSFTLALVVALTGVVYVQNNISWLIGFAIPAGCLLLSIIIFMIGRHTYVIAKPQGSVFLEFAKVISAASRKRSLNASGLCFYDPPVPNSSSQQEAKLSHTARFSFFDKAALIADQTELDHQGLPRNDWKLCSVQQVERFKMLLGMVPVWISGIGCFLAMDQQSNIGILQAIQTTKTIGSHFQIPPAWLGLSSMIALSIWIFIYEQIWVRQAQKLTGKSKRLTMAQRMNIGIVMGILSMLVAAIVEKHRREAALKTGSFESPLRITLLLPQFALSGMVEAFAAVALMEFLSTQLPESMRTVSGAIFFLSLSIASYVNSILVNIVRRTTTKNGTPWLGGKDLNKDRLENFYCLVGGLGVLNFIYFNVFAKRFLVTHTVEKKIHEGEQRNKGNALEMASSYSGSPLQIPV